MVGTQWRGVLVVFVVMCYIVCSDTLFITAASGKRPLVPLVQSYPDGLKLDAIKMKTLHEYCRYLPDSVHHLYPAPHPEELKRAEEAQARKREARRNIIENAAGDIQRLLLDNVANLDSDGEDGDGRENNDVPAELRGPQQLTFSR